MPENNQNELPKIGYLFHHPNISHPVDKFRLDIFITSESTEMHFDVLRATFPIFTPQNTVSTLKVSDPWKYEDYDCVCPGRVIMEDRRGKKEEAFSFGGDLQITSKESHTVCSLVSQAPILYITGGMKMDELFVEEVEILLAEQRAKFADHQVFKNQFCQTDPLELYTACLRGLREKIEGFKHKKEHYHDLLGYLDTQEHRLAAVGLLKETPLTFEDLVDV